MISLRTESGEETIPLEEFEARVRQGLIEPSTPVCFPVLTGDRWIDARDLEVFKRLYAPARIHFSRSFTLDRFPVATSVLVLAQLLIYFGIAGLSSSVQLDPLIDAGAKSQPNILELGETWRLLAANFLHRDIIHVVGNMFFLFNIGGAIENAYRLEDYVLILIVSALATTVLSTLMSAAPSVGFSGAVFGVMGAASVFGYKYSDILPERYRKYFGGAVLTYALFILYVGVAAKDVDNWGHLGGMLAGALVALPLEPRLLHFGKKRTTPLREHASALVVVGLVLATLATGPLLRLLPHRLETFDAIDSSIRVAYPPSWSVGVNHVGYPSWGNTLGASVGVRAERRSTHPATLREVRERFFEVELKERERDGVITNVRVVDERPVILDGGRAIELRITLESRAGLQITRNILIERGYYSYVVVLSAPERWAAAYAPIFDAMVEAIALTQPEPLGEAQALVSTFPGMSSAHVELGHQLASIGAVKAAAQAYQRALQALPEQADALYGLAKLAADYEGELDDAEKIAAALHEDRPDDPAYAALLADLRQRLGQIDGACQVLQETLDRVLDPPEDLRERLRSLKCRSAEPEARYQPSPDPSPGGMSEYR